MPRSREVYLLDPQVHSPETIAVAFAKTSRSPESFQKIASELTGESSAQFNEKWVVGYGHSSIAEHAVLHIAVENVSRLAVECLESNRLASYTEKSTRYQKWNSDDYLIPHEFCEPSSRKLYIDTCRMLFDLYDEFLPVVIQSVTREYEGVPGETPARKERVILTAAGDICRFLLPVSAYANVGVTINARALEHAITKMLSHPLNEVRDLGQEIKQIAQQSLPTLLKYANEQPSLIKTEDFFREYFQSVEFDREAYIQPGTRLISADPDLEEKIILSTIVRYSGLTYAQAEDFLLKQSPNTRDECIKNILGNLDEHDIPIRELEYGDLTFEILLDEGAYLELKRHRMMTQTPAPFSTRYGYSIPLQIKQAGLLEKYEKGMDKVNEVYDTLHSISPDAASYILPNAFNRLVIVQTNFRSFLHFVSLRSAPNAHFSMRRIAHQMADHFIKTYPTLGRYLKVNRMETASEIESRFFYRV
ncbi:MAG: FAD-dependent thymidylate synthase [Leptolinea sp.]|nr:FAD-dependent thymidylate synthase [Leptolinea sp.]